MFEDRQEELLELRQVCEQCGKALYTGSQTNSLTRLFLGNDFGSISDRWGCVCNQVEENSEFHGGATKAFQHKTIGDWKIEKLLGSGYMGAVYAASHTRSGDKACIRIFNPILSKNRRIAKRFLQEAEKAAQLTHRNIGLVYESGALPDGTTYTVSEYIEGETLEKKLEAEGFLDPLEALRIAEQILDALKEAHEQGILHRGIRPNNIIIQASGTVKLVDFGLEKAIPTAGRVTKCLSAYTGDLSDPHYMSPEQCMGQQLNQSSDIYSLGCVLYEMLTGKKVFQSRNWMQVAMSQLNRPPEPFSKVMYNCEISEAVELVVLKSLKKQRDQRYRSAAAFQEDISAVLHGKRPKFGGDGAPVPDLPTFKRQEPAHQPPPDSIPRRVPSEKPEPSKASANKMPAFLESADAEKTHDTQPWHPTASKRHWSLKPRLLERVFARLLDTGFNLSIGTAFAFLLVSFLQLLGLFRWWEHPTQLIVYWLALSFAALAVEPIMLSMRGTTPGKALLGIKVRNAVSGDRISFQKALRRTLAMSYLTGLLFIVVPFLNVGLCLILGLLQYDRLRKKGITTWDRDLHIYYRHYNVPTDRWFFVSMLSVFAFAVIVHTLTQAANALPYIAQQLNLR